MVLDFLNGTLPWSGCRDSNADDVKAVKERCLSEPEKFLWPGTPCDSQEMRNIFHSIRALEYQSRPNYAYIREQLLSMLNAEKQKEVGLNMLSSQIAIGGKRKLKNTNGAEKKAFDKGLVAKKSLPSPIFRIEKFSTSAPPLPATKDLFKIVIDAGYYKEVYGKA